MGNSKKKRRLTGLAVLLALTLVISSAFAFGTGVLSFTGGVWMGDLWGLEIVPQGDPDWPFTQEPPFEHFGVTPAFMSLMGSQVVGGAGLTWYQPTVESVVILVALPEPGSTAIFSFQVSNPGTVPSEIQSISVNTTGAAPPPLEISGNFTDLVGTIIAPGAVAVASGQVYFYIDFWWNPAGGLLPDDVELDFDEYPFFEFVIEMTYVRYTP